MAWIKPVTSPGYLVSIYGTNWVAVIVPTVTSTSVKLEVQVWQYPNYGGMVAVHSVTDTVSAGVGTGWIGVGLQVVPGTPNTTFRVWRKYGAEAAVLAGTYTPSNSSFTEGGGAAGVAAEIHLGDMDPADGVQNLNATAVRVYAEGSLPSLSTVESRFGSLSPDATAWADWPLTWTSGAAVLADQSGNGRSLTGVGVAYQGVPGPIDPGAAGITGTGAVSASALTASGSGSLAISGTGAASFTARTASGSGSLGAAPITGTGAVSASVQTASGVGALSITGTGSATLSSRMASGSGVLAITGTGAATFTALTASGLGSIGSTWARLGAHSLGWKEYGTSAPSITSGSMVTENGSAILAISERYPGTASLQPTDSKGNTFSQIGSSIENTDWPGSSGAIFAATGAAGGSAHTLSIGNSVGDEVTMFCAELRGVNRVESYASAMRITLSTAPATPSITVSGPAVLVAVYFCSVQQASQTFISCTNGFTIAEQQPLGEQAGSGAMAFREVSAAGTYSTAFNLATNDNGLVFIVALSSSPITGTGAAYGSASTASASGALAIAGTGTATRPSSTALGAGSLAVTGAGSVVPTARSASGAGSLGIAGTGSATRAASTASGVGSLAIAGTGATATMAPTTSGTGALAITGTASSSLSAPIASGSGSLSIAGTGAASIPAATASGAGALSISGTGVASFAASTAAGTGVLEAVLPPENMVGNGAATFAASVASGSGSMAIVGTGSVVLPASTTAASGNLLLVGTASVATAALLALSSGSMAIVGSGSALFASQVSGASGALTIIGTGSAFSTPSTARAFGSVGDSPASVTGIIYVDGVSRQIVSIKTVIDGSWRDVIDVQVADRGTWHLVV
jgi:hypothetical protein